MKQISVFLLINEKRWTSVREKTKHMIMDGFRPTTSCFINLWANLCKPYTTLHQFCRHEALAICVISANGKHSFTKSKILLSKKFLREFLNKKQTEANFFTLFRYHFISERFMGLKISLLALRAIKENFWVLLHSH